MCNHPIATVSADFSSAPAGGVMALVARGFDVLVIDFEGKPRAAL